MAETSYIIQNGKMMYVKDASARKSIGSCGNLKTETKHCLVDAINELNDKVGGGGGGGGTSLDGLEATVDELNALVGVDGNVQEQLDGKAPYGLVSVTHVTSTDEEILTDLDAVIAGMEDGTIKFVRVSGKVGTFLNDRVAVAEVFRAGANYCTVKMYTYIGGSSGSVAEYYNSKINGAWQKSWSRNYNTGYKPKLTDLGLTATAAELNRLDGDNATVQKNLGLFDRFYSLKGGTYIPENADLNTYVTPGNYCCYSTSTAKTLTNCPVTVAFTMKVTFANGTQYVDQEVRAWSTGIVYRRYNKYTDNSDAGWSEWTDELQKNGITATADELNLLDSGIPESKISHGDTDHWENTLPPFTGIKVNRSRANRFALMPANKILVERSTDAGVTWVEDTDFADADKVNLLTNAVDTDVLRIMNNLSANERLRITLIAPSGARTKINQIYTDISTRGHGVRVDIEGALNSAPNTFSILGNNVRLGGWNGPNVINIPEITWGPSSGSDYGKIRITYKISAVSSSQTGKAIVLAIKGYGPYAFYMHSNLAFDDCLYEVNHNGDATFPANLTAKTIAGVTPTEIGYLAGTTGNVQEQLNKIRETQTSGAEAMTEATIRAICT